MQHAPDFGIGKAKVFIIFCICNGQYAEIVKTCENTLFCDSETAGEHRKMKAAVAFQGATEKAADQAHNFIVIAGMLRFVQRNVILIY